MSTLLGGMKIIVSEHATEPYYLFGHLKRTKRGRRRRAKKYPVQWLRRPAAYLIPGATVMHPALHDRLRQAVKIENVGS